MKLALRNKRDEKRSNRRVHIELPIGIAVLSKRLGFPPRRPQFNGVMRLASMVGMEIRSDRNLGVGIPVRLWIVAEPCAETTLKLRGNVVWSKPDERDGSFLAGIRLDERPREEMTNWQNLIAERLRRLDE